MEQRMQLIACYHGVLEDRMRTQLQCQCHLVSGSRREIIENENNFERQKD